MLCENIDIMQHAAVIKPIYSKLISAFVQFLNKDGTIFCFVDYQPSNAASIVGTYSQPLRDECINSLLKAKVITVLEGL